MVKFVLFLYRIISYVVLVISYIVYLITRKEALAERLALHIKSIKPSIWVHCASIGEVLSVETLIKYIQSTYPNYEIILTSHTVTSKKIASNFTNIKHCYLPYDNTILAKNFIKNINCKLVLWIEQDYFPLIFKELSNKNIPILLLNARMSDKSFSTWLKFKDIAGYILSSFTSIYSMSKEDKLKLKNLGANNTHYIGNLKYTNLGSNINFEIKNLIERFSSNKKIILALSTHKNEEIILQKAYMLAIKDLKNESCLIIQPRHPLRCTHILKTLRIETPKEKIITFSSFKKNPENFNIMIIDTTGETDTLCAVADIAFIGKSILPQNKGGQNLIEPLKNHTPVIFGPYMDNFKEVAKECLENKAGVMVKSIEDIKNIFQKIINDSTFLETLTNNTKYISKNGATILNNYKKIVEKYLENEHTKFLEK